MLSFKQFLLEGGAATKKLGTTRATKADIEEVLKLLGGVSGIPVSTLQGRLLGSTRLTHGGHQKDSGDIDVAISTDEIDQDELVAALEKKLGNSRPIGGSTFSFAVPANGHKVQLDVMFVPDIEWALFSHHAAESSKHKSGVRNELLHSALKWSMEPGKDVRLKDADGNDLARASRSYKLDQGVERIFKIAPKRKDGKGRVRGVEKVSPDRVRDTLDELGYTDTKFDPSTGTIRDPDIFAKLLFGQKAKAADLASTEQVISMIKKNKARNADEILRDAVKGIKRLKFPIPDELKAYA